jgi:hypothetical protein
MTSEEFLALVEEGGTVPLSAEEWDGIAPQFEVWERHATQLAGELLIVHSPVGLIAVEAPSRGARVARLLGGEEEAKAFVFKRMEEYERMWDGCGVKVDYYR